MRKRLLLLVASAAALSLVAAACGDDEPTEETSEPPEETSEPPEETSEPPEETSEPDEETSEPDEEVSEPDEGIKVGLVFDIGGEGDLSFNDSAAAGLTRAEDELGVSTSKVSPNDDGSNRADLLQLQADQSDIVVAVGFLFEGDAATVGGANPETNFSVVDSSMLNFEADPPVPYADNIAGLVFSEEQGSFLVGATAALKSETGTIGFIGGVCCFGLIEKFEAGYIAGAKAVNPDIEIISQYITEFPDFGGFNDPASGRETGLAMYEKGADIVYHAAGGTGTGLFTAAKIHSEESGSKVWAIGVDSDQYHTVSEDLREYVLTSMLKRVDTAVFETIKAHVSGTFSAGEIRYDLAVDGVGYSTSGGFVDDIVEELENYKKQIVDGDIVVPTDPKDA